MARSPQACKPNGQHLRTEAYIEDAAPFAQPVLRQLQSQYTVSVRSTG